MCPIRKVVVPQQIPYHNNKQKLISKLDEKFNNFILIKNRIDSLNLKLKAKRQLFVLHKQVK